MSLSADDNGNEEDGAEPSGDAGNGYADRISTAHELTSPQE